MPNDTKNKIIEPAVVWRFKVTVEGYELGLWNSFEGLGWEVTMEQRVEGGNNFFVHELPGNLKFTHVKIGRPLNADSSKVAEWFASMATGVKRTTAQIVALGGDGEEICQWGLDGVVPVRWTGPSFNVETTKIATETLELAHHGFLDPAKKV
jgi:phage tail-like protein